GSTMNITPDKTLTVIDAARLLYRTKSPSQAQVNRIQKLMKAGVLPECNCDGPPLSWTTTAGAIADHLAKESVEKQSAKHVAASGIASTPSLFKQESFDSENE